MGFVLGGRRAIVTGGALGIGKAITRALLEAGCRVCIADINPEAAETTSKELQAELGLGDDWIGTTTCNVCNKSDWQTAWDEAERKLDGKIDILCNNAGIAYAQSIDAVLKINACGTLLGMEMALAKMSMSKGGNGGRIVNMASFLGLHNIADCLSSATYTASKYCAVVLTRAIRNFPQGEGVKCYAMAPAFVRTQMGAAAVKKFAGHAADGDSADSLYLEPRDVANGVVKALELDKNGAVYAQRAGVPLIEFPFVDNQMLEFTTKVARMANTYLGTELVTSRQLVVYGAIMIFVLCIVVEKVLCYALSSLF